jgi:hypothetical protein
MRRRYADASSDGFGISAVGFLICLPLQGRVRALPTSDIPKPVDILFGLRYQEGQGLLVLLFVRFGNETDFTDPGFGRIRQRFGDEVVRHVLIGSDMQFRLLRRLGNVRQALIQYRAVDCFLIPEKLALAIHR